MAKKLMSVRMWILTVSLVIFILAISPNPWASGLEIKSVDDNSQAAEEGLKQGMIIKSINGEEITELKEFLEIKEEYEEEEKEIRIRTEEREINYNATYGIGFDIDENISVRYNIDSPLRMGEKIIEINGERIADKNEFYEAVEEILPKKTVKIETNQGEFAYLTRGLGINAKTAEKSNLKKGLELSGGTRVLIKPEKEEEITDKDINDLIKVLDNRLNLYGLADLKIREAEDWQGNRFVLVEIAGATKEDVKELIGQQGKFEAKIGDELIFTGGEDIPFVCRDDGSCSGIRECLPTGENNWYCKFEFVVHLTPEAAKRHAKITGNLNVVSGEGGNQILSEKIDFYLDERQVDSLNIGADLKGKEATRIAISGPGYGNTKMMAVERASKNMDQLQTVLITGSLPIKINIVKLDTISPILGKNFINNAFLVGFLAMIAVVGIVMIRYKQVKIVIPVVVTLISEIVMILGFAALIEWNLDLASIAGIIAAVGTGVDHQIVITDEILRGGERYFNWKEKIKRAFYIIMIAYATTVAAMIPLWNAGAGLIRGFAVTTIIGVTIGVFITRPAFASMMEYFLKE